MFELHIFENSEEHRKGLIREFRNKFKGNISIRQYGEYDNDDVKFLKKVFSSLRTKDESSIRILIDCQLGISWKDFSDDNKSFGKLKYLSPDAHGVNLYYLIREKYKKVKIGLVSSSGRKRLVQVCDGDNLPDEVNFRYFHRNISDYDLVELISTFFDIK